MLFGEFALVVATVVFCGCNMELARAAAFVREHVNGAEGDDAAAAHNVKNVNLVEEDNAVDSIPLLQEPFRDVPSVYSQPQLAAFEYPSPAQIVYRRELEESRPLEKRAQTFVRFGKRAQTFVRFGKRAQTFVRFG